MLGSSLTIIDNDGDGDGMHNNNKADKNNTATNAAPPGRQGVREGLPGCQKCLEESQN
ncbi:MAG: hypothetical protein JWR35_3696 [Marmoricola sp.]|nr:hypothetical protein [Marmoricola sp.]